MTWKAYSSSNTRTSDRTKDIKNSIALRFFPFLEYAYACHYKQSECELCSKQGY